MAADAQGNDITTVGVPVTGNIGLAPFGTAFPSPSEGAAYDLQLEAAFRKIGLLKTDGGPQWAWAPSGDAIEFWQDGYSIPSGLADVTVTISAAQTDDIVRSIVYGKEPDPNHFVTVDGGGHADQYVLFTEEIFKNGQIRRRVAPNAQVQSVAEDKSERGTPMGYQIVFKINRSVLVANEHFGEWLLPAEEAAA